MDDVKKQFGFVYLAGKDIAVILRRRKFDRLERGPKYCQFVPVVEKIAFMVEAIPDAFKFISENIQTHDGLLVRIETRVEYVFDPTALDISKQAGMCKRFQFVVERQELIRDLTRRVLQEVVSAYPGIVVCSMGHMWTVIEAQWRERLAAQIASYGLTLFTDRCSVMEIVPPETVRQRIELSAERLINAMMLNQLNPADQARVLRAEAIESLKDMAGAMPRLNISDMPEPYAQLNSPSNHTLDTPALPPATGTIVIGASHPVEQKPKPAVANDTATQATHIDDADDEPYSLME